MEAIGAAAALSDRLNCLLLHQLGEIAPGCGAAHLGEADGLAQGHAARESLRFGIQQLPFDGGRAQALAAQQGADRLAIERGLQCLQPAQQRPGCSQACSTCSAPGSSALGLTVYPRAVIVLRMAGASQPGSFTVRPRP
jgi:hypothetical protein